MLDVPLLIGGQSCPARDGRTVERRNGGGSGRVPWLGRAGAQRAP